MKILTIDFDIIMAPSIGIYNDLVPKYTIEELVEKNKYIALATIDYLHYKRLTGLLLHYIQQLSQDNIIFIIDHEQVLDYIPNHEKIELINIDHHHDLGYNQTAAQTVLSTVEPDCSTWVKYLFDNNQLQSYTWINNSNSIEPLFDETKRILTEKYPLQNCEDLFTAIGKIDKLIICLSPAWIPPEIRNLFDTWVELTSTFYNNKMKIQEPSYIHIEKLKKQNNHCFN